MEEKVCPDKAQFLKKAKWAIRRSYWLNQRLPKEYHSVLVNLECCSLHCLRVCLQNCSLSPEAEMLLFDKFANDHPDILRDYIRAHGATLALLSKLIENKNLELLECFLDKRRYYSEMFLLPSDAQIVLVKSDDVDFFQKVLNLGVQLADEAFALLLQRGHYDMLAVYCKSCFWKDSKTYLQNQWFDIVFQRHDMKAIELLLNYFKLTFEALVKLVDTGHKDLVTAYFKTNDVDKDVQCQIAQSTHKKLIALYLQNKPFDKAAQLALVKSGYKDLLKMHYLKYGLNDEVIVFQASLNFVKSYLGV